MKRIFILAFALGTLNGCTSIKNPVHQHQLANVGALSTVASRRVVLVNSRYHGGFKLESELCAEPSPDVTENIVSSFSSNAEIKGAAETKAEIAKIEAQAKLELAKSLSSLGESLFARTQGAQMFRDGAYNLCQAYINRAISREQYVSAYSMLLESSTELIKHELALKHAKEKANK